MKKFLFLAPTALLFACGSESGGNADITIYHMPGCPYCEQALKFVDNDLKGTSVEKIDVTTGGKAVERFNAQLETCKLTSRGVPLIVVKGECLQGFAPEIGAQIKTKLGK